jgi:hypothetical protein
MGPRPRGRQAERQAEREADASLGAGLSALLHLANAGPDRRQHARLVAAGAKATRGGRARGAAGDGGPRVKGVYRDPVDAVRTRIAQHRAEIAEREARLTELLWELLPADDAARLRELRGTSEPSRDTMHELARADGVLEAYRDALDQAIALAPSLEVERRVVPDAAPDPRPLRAPEPWVLPGFETTRVQSACDWLHDRVRGVFTRLDPRAAVETLGRLAMRVRFRSRGAPLSLLCEMRLRGDVPTECDMALATSVSSGTPALRLRPWTWTDALAKSMRLVRDMDVGDEEFDALFLVDAAREAARRLLSFDVRSGLRALSYYDMPTMEIGDGMALLRWSFEPNVTSIDAAARSLSGVRGATFDTPLLHPGVDEED